MATASRVIRVLCVDDEPDLADMAAAFLKRDGDRLSVRTVESAQEALAVLDGDPIECIVSDCDMLGTNGIELLERVRTAHADLPFILYTGTGPEVVASDAISAGVTARRWPATPPRTNASTTGTDTGSGRCRLGPTGTSPTE